MSDGNEQVFLKTRQDAELNKFCMLFQFLGNPRHNNYPTTRIESRARAMGREEKVSGQTRKLAG
jgi:hypothetical protein